jgi:hypothetical protein
VTLTFTNTLALALTLALTLTLTLTLPLTLTFTLLLGVVLQVLCLLNARMPLECSSVLLHSGAYMCMQI